MEKRMRDDCASNVELVSAKRASRDGVATQGYWERMARSNVLFSEDDAPMHEFEWRLLVDAAMCPIDHGTTLLADVTGCSSTDRHVELPTNTLTPSMCWLMMRLIPELDNQVESDGTVNQLKNAQIECGCEIGDACYWSTMASTDPTTQDFIDYTVAPQSVVRLLQVIPYRAMWHEDYPTYGPRAISFHFYSTRSRSDPTTEKELLHVSPVFPLDNKMQLNEFMLPQPLWFPNGGIMRLNLYGRYQVDAVNRTLQFGNEDYKPEFYTCLSYVGALGTPFLQLPPPPPPPFAQPPTHGDPRWFMPRG